MRIWLIIFFCLVPSLSSALTLGIQQTVTSNETQGSYLVEEYFTTGSIPTGWTAVSSTLNYGYTTSPAPLEGTYSVLITGGSTTRRATSITYSAQNEVYAAIQFNYASTPGIADTFFAINTTDAYTQLCKLIITSSNQLGVQASGGTYNTGVTTLTPGNTYWAALHYVAGSGTNALCAVYLSSTAPTTVGAWGSVEASSTNGTTTATTDRLFFGNAGDAGIPDVIFDSVKLKASLPTY